MKTWVKGGIIGAGTVVLARILLFISLSLFYTQTKLIIPDGDDLNLLIVGIFILIGFIIGALIGWAVEKFGHSHAR